MTTMRVAGAFALAILCGLATYIWFRQAAPQPAATPLSANAQAAFFQHYENGRYAEAFAILPSALRNWAPEEKEYELYDDIAKKASGKRRLPKQHALDKEILYYQGVMHFRMNRMAAAQEKLLKCLQLDPTYRMAHVYLSWISARTYMSSRQRYHSEQDIKLLKLAIDETLSVYRLSLTKRDAAIKNLKAEYTSMHVGNWQKPSLKDNNVARHYRVELVTANRHCIDQVFFPPEPTETIFHWDGRNASGRPTGGQEVWKSYRESLYLVAGSDAERIIVYNPEGQKVAELRVAP